MTIERAQELVRQGRPGEALAVLDQLAAADPAMLGHRAYFHRCQGRFEEALADYERHAEAFPGDFESASRRAETLLMMGRARQALAAAVEVLGRHPENLVAAGVVVAAQEALGLRPMPPAPMPSPEAIAPTRPLNAVIDALERDPASYPTSVFPEIGRFLYQIVRLLRPARAIETGAFIGYSSLCIGQAMEDNGGGVLESFDLFIDRPEYASPVLGPSPNALAAARGHADRAGLGHRIAFHAGDSAPTIDRVFAERPGPVQFAFIDGDHTMRGAQADWLAVDRVLAPGGVAVFHDTMPDACGWCGPRWLLEELEKAAPGDYGWVNLPSPEGYGMAVLQKRGDARSPHWRPSFVQEAAERFFHRNRLRRPRG